MAALTQDRQGRAPSEILATRYFPVAASTFIGQHWLVSFDASGNLVPVTDAGTFANKAVYFSLEQADNTDGVAGAKQCKCLVRGTIVTESAGTNTVTDARRGMNVHAITNHEVATASTNNVTFGRVLDVSADGVHINI